MSKTTINFQIKKEVLSWARKSSGLEIDDVAYRLNKKIKGASKEIIDSWESGISNPSFEQLKSLAAIYKRPLAVFFLNTVPVEEPLPKDFRTVNSQRTQIFSYKMRLALRWARRAQKISSALLESNNKSTEFSYSKTSIYEDYVALSNKIRLDFNFSKKIQTELKSEGAVFDFLRSKIEESGVIVLKTPPQFSFPIEEARAISFVDKKPFTILINNRDDQAPKNFSLLHEFAHLLLRETGVCSVDYSLNNSPFGVGRTETFCNYFASNFLIPDNFITSLNINRFTFRDDTNLETVLSDLSKVYKVSKHVVLRKLLDLNLIDTSIYRNKVASWRRHKPRTPSFGRSTPSGTALKANGLTYSGLVLDAYKNDKITFNDASDYLNIKSKYLPQLENLVFEK